MSTILSLFDYSGGWSQPYRDKGYDVYQIDIKLGTDVLSVGVTYCEGIAPVVGVLAAPPCTHFAGSGAQYWKAKDADGRTAEAVSLITHTLQIIEWTNPNWWALENPVGRLPKLVPEIGKPWYFQPHWYGDPYTKKTGLWGNFNRDLVRNDVDPQRVCPQGSWLQRLGGSSERTKELRSMTPPGFAQAFCDANP